MTFKKETKDYFFLLLCLEKPVWAYNKIKRGQIMLAPTCQPGFPTRSFQQLNCIVQIHNNTAAKGKFLPELLLS